MGNCWRVPEDRASLLPMPSTHYASTTVSSSTSQRTRFVPLNTSMPKLVASSRLLSISSAETDINIIKEARRKNLFEHLPIISYNENTIQQTECAICLIDFTANEQVRQLPCHSSHVFHPGCIDGWLQKSLTCPQCSANIDAALLLKFALQSNVNNYDDD